MAQFKTHISWGVLVAIAVIVAGFILAIFARPISAGWIFLAVIIGSFMPDLDMDGGVPFQIIFGLLSAGFAGIIFLNLYQLGERDWKVLSAYTVFAFIFVRFVVGKIFEHFTNHRGMFHSIPAAILSGLISIWILHYFSLLVGLELLFGFAVSIGYVGHLILDEIYSAIDLHGRSIFPKNSLGSALKLYAHSHASTFLFYALIAFLAFSLPETKNYFLN
jgi:hypothetical protein